MAYSYFIARSIQRYIQQRQRDKARIARAAQRAAEAKARYDHEVTPRQQRAFAVINQHAAQTKEHARVYRFARDAMLDTLDAGKVRSYPLQRMQQSLARTEPVKQAFGEHYYAELRELLDRVEKLPVTPQYIHAGNATDIGLWVIVSIIGLLVIGGLVLQ